MHTCLSTLLQRNRLLVQTHACPCRLAHSMTSTRPYLAPLYQNNSSSLGPVPASSKYFVAREMDDIILSPVVIFSSLALARNVTLNLEQTRAIWCKVSNTKTGNGQPEKFVRIIKQDPPRLVCHFVSYSTLMLPITSSNRQLWILWAVCSFAGKFNLCDFKSFRVSDYVTLSLFQLSYMQLSVLI